MADWRHFLCYLHASAVLLWQDVGRHAAPWEHSYSRLSAAIARGPRAATAPVARARDRAATAAMLTSRHTST